MYSQYDLISEELKQYEKKTLLDRILGGITKRNNFTFHIPLSQKRLFRLSVLIEDIQDMGYSDFNANTLIEILYFDFIDQIRIRNSMEVLYNLLNLKNTQFAVSDLAYVDVKLDRKKVLRGEVFLEDMSSRFNHSFTVERVLELLLLDFLQEYVKDPGVKIQEILKNYE